MSLASVSVKRYVFAAMLNAVIILFGIVAYSRMGIERLPNVPESYGVRAVSAITKRTQSTGTRNSSATPCVSAVRVFCPTSALPVNATILPSSPT